MKRILKNNSYTLYSPIFTSGDEETPTDCSSTPTCTVTREDGTALTAASVTKVDTGLYTAAITTNHTSRVDWLQISWSGTNSTATQTFTQELSVVGSHYFTIPELRNMYPELSDTTKHPTDQLQDLRDYFADIVERICGTAFARSYWRQRFPGGNQQDVLLERKQPRSLISVTINGSSQSLSNFSIDRRDQWLRFWNGIFPAPNSSYGLENCVVEYEYGWDSCPPELKREAMKAVRAEALARISSIPADAISQTFDGQTFRFSTPNPDAGRYTGIKSLDPVLYTLMEGPHVA